MDESNQMFQIHYHPDIDGYFDPENKKKIEEWVQKYGNKKNMLCRTIKNKQNVYFVCKKIWYTDRGIKRIKTVKVFDNLNEAEQFQQRFNQVNANSKIEINITLLKNPEDPFLKKYHVLFHPIVDKDLGIRQHETIDPNNFTISL